MRGIRSRALNGRIGRNDTSGTNGTNDHDDMDAKEDSHTPPLPEVHSAILSAELLAQLLADLREHGQILAVQCRGTRGGPATPATLDDVPRLLSDGHRSAVQVVYRHAGITWIDTLSPTPEGTRLVRMQRPVPGPKS